MAYIYKLYNIHNIYNNIYIYIITMKNTMPSETTVKSK